MRIALRVEVRSERGLRRGVPALMRLFDTYQVRASFFFPLGQDVSGRQPFRSWRARRWLGCRSLVLGTLLPAADLAAASMRLAKTARENGHDVGLFGGSPLAWAAKLAFADDAWVQAEMTRMLERCGSDRHMLPTALATPGWQVHPALIAGLGESRFRYTSVTRGKLPYRPTLQGRRSNVPEVPTTLPTVDEMLRRPGVTPSNVHEYLYADSRRLLPAGHVFALSADREGQDRLELMEKLLVMWKGQDGAVHALDDVLRQVDPKRLPRHQVGWTTPAGADRAMAAQSIEVPA